MRIPIAVNVDSPDAIGELYTQGTGFYVQFKKGHEPTRDEFFKMMNCGVRVLEVTEDKRIIRAQVHVLFGSDPIL